jgi:hypothetical protein
VAAGDVCPKGRLILLPRSDFAIVRSQPVNVTMPAEVHLCHSGVFGGRPVREGYRAGGFISGSYPSI